MSGPKRADVEAQLNRARNSQAACANLVAQVENSTITSVLRQAELTAREAEALGKEATRLLEGLGAAMTRAAPGSVQSARITAAETQSLVADALALLQRSRSDSERARRAEDSAKVAFTRANQEYDRAEAALRSASNHYLTPEMEQAKAATRLFDEAARQLLTAGQARQETARGANAALQRANEALAAARNAENRLRATRSEAEARLRAEEEARRITEEKRRRATLAVDQAEAGLSRLNDLPHAKFRAGEGNRLRKELDEAAHMVQQGRYDEAAAAADRVQPQAIQLEREVSDALREYERQRAEASTHVSGLKAAVDAMDGRLIHEWADNPAALEEARAALERGSRSLSSERFADAQRETQSAKDALNEALRSAAENQAAHERRQNIGAAVMASLEELGFDVSFEPGSRTEPLRIAGQTPDEAGRGDFDIAIPLDGEVGFHIQTPEGDTTCVAAVEALQQRLASRGIAWQTTDWGHAQDAEPIVPRSHVEKVQQKIKSKSVR